MGWNPWKQKQTPLLRKMKKYKKNDAKVAAKKGMIQVYAFIFVISWIWSAVPDRDISVWGCLGMLLFGSLIYQAIRYIFQQDPVQEAINDLEIEFWDRESTYNRDFRKGDDPKGI